MKQTILSSKVLNISTRSETIKKPTPCCAKVGVKRGPWTPEEDEVLCDYIKKEGSAGRWRTLPKRAGLSRCGKSCRLRWMNYLRPCVKRGHIDSDEEDLILRLHRLLGNRCSKPPPDLYLSKKLISQGIDPRTHKPLESTNNKPSSSTLNYSQNPNHFATPPPSYDPTVHNQFTETFGYYYEEGTNIDHYHGLDLQISDVIQNEDNYEDDNLNYCNDDIFSSFLNSLINDDVYGNSQNQMQQQQELVTGKSTVPQASSCDALISVPQMNFAFGTGWDAPIMSEKTEKVVVCKTQQ